MGRVGSTERQSPFDRGSAGKASAKPKASIITERQQEITLSDTSELAGKDLSNQTQGIKAAQLGATFIESVRCNALEEIRALLEPGSPAAALL